MVPCEYDRTVFGHIVEIIYVNTAKKRIDDDTDKPIDKALKHVINQETPERTTLRFRLGTVNAVKASRVRNGLCVGYSSWSPGPAARDGGLKSSR